jgi:protein-S-isoprenylcysteine O-methyltransferase Ste14
MFLVYRYLFAAMWIGYFGYWQVKAANSKASERTEPTESRLTRLILVICSFVLLGFPSVPIPYLNRRFLPRTLWCFWVGAALTAAGLLFAIWARRHLGTNWSREVTVKQGHELITTGPYALVRHPIYTGLLLAIIGTAVAGGKWRGLVAVLLVLIAIWRKLKLEEKWMSERFGETYQAYARRVAALVPHLI